VRCYKIRMVQSFCFIMLHGDGKFQTYLSFFSHLNGELKNDVSAAELRVDDAILTGSDEETALVSAMKTAFPGSKHLFCMLHCKDNARHHLTKIGVPLAVRESLLSLLFAPDGLSGSGDEVGIDNKTAEIMQFIRQNNIDAVDYIRNRIITKIVSNCKLRWEESCLGREHWTNNNCESINHVLKMDLDWKPARVTDLVDRLRDLVRLQFVDCSVGEFQVAPILVRYVVPQSAWATMSEEQRSKLVEKFLADTGVRLEQKTVISSDGLLTVTGSPRIARKQHQRQRPKATRTSAW